LTAIYAESSAVLGCLLDTADAPVPQNVLASAQVVVTSSLTSTEVAGTLQRVVELR